MTDEPAAAAQRRKRKRRRKHKHPAHPRASKQARALAHRLRTQFAKPQADATVKLAPLAKGLHRSIEQMRHDVQRRGGPGTAAAVAGLREVEHSLGKLVAAGAATTPEHAARLLGDGATALAKARRHAHKAGDAWPA